MSNSGAIVVSGCPRSGTSLMMQIMREALGPDRIIGDRFPFEKGAEQERERKDGENDTEYEMRLYTIDLERPNAEAEAAETKDMNPGGFWECIHTSRGLVRRPGPDHRAEAVEILNAKKPKVVKVVSQGLAGSDPDLISKVVLMMRNPRSVAKSQERLKRDLVFWNEKGQKLDLFSGLKVHSPKMFIRVTWDLAYWLTENEDVDILPVLFDDLLQSPAETLANVQRFLGEGDFKAAAKIVNPRLNRSMPEEQPSALWPEAEYVYERLKQLDFADIIRYMSDPARQYNIENSGWMCPRMGEVTVAAHCKKCLTDAKFRHNLRAHAEKHERDWKNAPCAYECAYAVDQPLKTIDESIADNHWLEKIEPLPLPVKPPEPVSPPKGPNIVQKAVNLARDGGAVVAGAIKGEGLMLTKHEAEVRHAVCRGCSFYRADTDECTHKRCGCKMKATVGKLPGKINFAKMACPEGKWPL